MIKIQNETGKVLWTVQDDATGLPEELLPVPESTPVDELPKKEEGKTNDKV